MIQEKFVSFEIANLLKEKGLTSTDVVIYCMYDINGNIHWGIYDKDWFPRITIQTAMEWLRIKHNLFIEIRVGETNQKTWYDFDIIPINGKEIDWEIFDDIPIIECESPEDAIEFAIKYCLENLI